MCLKIVVETRASKLLTLLVFSCFSACASNELSGRPVTTEVLLGTWQVDLRPTPDSEPYYKDFVVTSVDETTFAGTFYDTTVSQARINTDWGKVRIAFTTNDASGTYSHSAVLEDDRLEGLSNSNGRNFLSYWSAVKK